MNKSSKWFSVIVSVCFVACFMLFCSCSSRGVETQADEVQDRVQVEETTQAEVKDWGTEYRYVEVYSNGKNVLKLRGTLGVKTCGNVTVIKNKNGKEHLFINADVIIRQIDKGSIDKQVSESNEVSQESKGVSSRVEGSGVSKAGSSVGEASKYLEASKVTISVSTSENSSISGNSSISENSSTVVKRSNT